MKFTRPARLSTTLAVAILLLAGCAGIEPLDYPHEWSSGPGKVLPNGCPDLSGSYATRATDAYPVNVGDYPPLHEILGPGVLRDAEERDSPWPASPRATTATFTANGDWLYVRFHGNVESEAVLKFKRKGWWGGSTDGSDAMYQCLKLELGPALGFDGPRKPIISVPYLFAEDDMNFVFLSRGQDGSLIVNYRTDRVFITGGLIGSHARWAGSVWWRYPPVLSNR